MLVRRFYDDRLAQASYLIACQRTGEAIVIDPARDVSPYLAAAKQEGVRITRVTETHIHADFLSGARQLARDAGATLLLSGHGGTDWSYRYATTDGAQLLRDGDVVTMGGVTLQVWHTPGHTPEHLSFLVTDAARSTEPVALVSGDFVFVGDVGRPDLLEKTANVAGSMAAGAKDLFRSLQRLASLPDHLQIWPGHGAGSACGKALGALPTSTLGYERLTNWAFGVPDEATFVATVLEGQPTPPPYFGVMKRDNRDGPALLDAGALEQLPTSRWDDALRGGVIVDLRAAKTYGEAHLAGTINLPFNKSFTKWAGWLLPYDRDIHLVAESESVADDARTALRAIGLDRVAGWFAATIVAEARWRDSVKSADHGSINDAPTLSRDGWTILDIRESSEWDAGHVPGARHHPLGRLRASVAELDRATPVAVHCQAGGRSAIATSLLEAMGFTAVRDLADGWSGWNGGR